MNSFSLSEVVTALSAEGLLEEIVGDLPHLAESITEDSRRTQPGSVFLAIAGSVTDGHDFISAAESSGAIAVICERRVDSSLPQIVVKDGRRAAAIAAEVAYGRPADSLRIIGVTGTNGKTTTVGLLRHLFDQPPGSSASIGTIGVLIGSEGASVPGGNDLTTPGPVELQRVLRDLVESGVKTVAMEVSSHSLDQRRIEGLSFTAVLFTNLSRDHLDYHGTMQRYREAKLRLLDYLQPAGTVVVNADDSAWESPAMDGRRAIRFSVQRRSDVFAAGVEPGPTGTSFDLCVGEWSERIEIPLIGDFNVANALGAAAVAWAMGLAEGEIATRLQSIPQVPGRLELISHSPVVLRDYAHTPDAMRRALNALRPVAKGRLICVFGCGGDRDKGKRPLMGAAAEELSDYSIVTSDNPRTEPPERIIDDIVAGMKSNNYERIADRRDAIARALEIAKPEDLIVLAGKGHETYQIRGTEKFPFDEKLIVAELRGLAS